MIEKGNVLKKGEGASKKKKTSVSSRHSQTTSEDVTPSFQAVVKSTEAISGASAAVVNTIPSSDSTTVVPFPLTHDIPLKAFSPNVVRESTALIRQRAPS